jgi:uncharacterized protein (UPF0216 family)
MNHLELINQYAEHAGNYKVKTIVLSVEQAQEAIIEACDQTKSEVIEKVLEVLQAELTNDNVRLQTEHDKQFKDLLSFNSKISNNLKLLFAYHTVKLETLITQIKSI